MSRADFIFWSPVQARAATDADAADAPDAPDAHADAPDACRPGAHRFPDKVLISADDG